MSESSDEDRMTLATSRLLPPPLTRKQTILYSLKLTLIVAALLWILGQLEQIGSWCAGRGPMS